MGKYNEDEAWIDEIDYSTSMPVDDEMIQEEYEEG